MRCGSKQREYIVEYMRGTTAHPDAHEIYEHVREKFPNVSLGTVYRNLEYLLVNNVIRKVQAACGFDRYDYVRERHNHALCSVCGKIYDFIYPLDPAALQSAIGEDKFVINDADFLVVGVCSDCARNTRRESESKAALSRKN